MSDAPALDQARVQQPRPREILAALLQDSDDGVWVVDATGSLLLMNPAAERLLGWREDALRGTAIHDAIHGPGAAADGTLRPHAACPLLDVLQTGRRVTIAEDAFTRQDGAALQVAYTATPILSAGQVQGAITVFHDLAERQHSEAALGWLAVIMRDITERKRVELELHVRARQQAALAELSQRALACDDLSTLLDEAVALVAHTLEIEHCTILELLPDGTALRFRAGVGWRDGIVGQATPWRPAGR